MDSANSPWVCCRPCINSNNKVIYCDSPPRLFPLPPTDRRVLPIVRLCLFDSKSVCEFKTEVCLVDLVLGGMIATSNFFKKREYYSTSQWSRQNVDAQNFLPLRVASWVVERGLDLFNGDVEPKTLHRACWATQWLMVHSYWIADLSGPNTHKEGYNRK